LSVLAADEETLSRRIARGYELACKMSWDRVVGEYFLPALAKAALQE